MTDSREPAAPLAPVRARRGSRDAAVIALLIVGALVAGVALGFRLGAQANETAVVVPSVLPTPGPSPTPLATPATQPTFPPYPIQAGTITDELRSAYYEGGLGVAVCVGYEDIVCQGRDGLVPVEPVADVITRQEFEALYSAGPVTELKVDSTFAVEDLGDRYVEGILFHESDFAFGGYEVSAVNPDGGASSTCPSRRTTWAGPCSWCAASRLHHCDLTRV